MKPSQIVTSGDVEIAVYSWGKASTSKPTILLVHGYPDAAGVWRATAEALAARHHVVAYDVRGAGRSTRPSNTAAYDIALLMKDLAAVIKAVSPGKPVHLVCHDWGSIACWEAVTTSALAGRIASYTSISGPSLDHAGYWLAERLKSRSPARIAEAARQFAHSWYMFLFKLPVLPEGVWRHVIGKNWPALLARVEGIARPEASATQIEDGMAGVNIYRANVLKRVLNPQVRRTQLPVQLIVATRDKFMVGEIFDDLLQWAPKLWRREVDAGHWVQVSHPQRVADLAAEFVGFVESGKETAALKAARVVPPAPGADAANKQAAPPLGRADLSDNVIPA